MTALWPISFCALLRGRRCHLEAVNLPGLGRGKDRPVDARSEPLARPCTSTALTRGKFEWGESLAIGPIVGKLVTPAMDSTEEQRFAREHPSEEKA